MTDQSCPRWTVGGWGRLTAAGTADLHDFPLGQTDSGQVSAPQAPRIERNQVGGHFQAERRPVTNDECFCRAFAAGYLEPRQMTCRSVFWLTLDLKIHHPLARTEAHACHGIDYDPRPIHRTQSGLPAQGAVA